MRLIPIWVTRRLGCSNSVLWLLTALCAVVLLFVEMRTTPVSPNPANVAAMGPVSKEAPMSRTHKQDNVQPVVPVQLDPDDPNNAPLEPTHDRHYKSTRTLYQWEWVKSASENTVVIVDAFIVYRNDSGVSVAILGEGQFSGIKFPTKTDYTSDYECIWDDGSRNAVNDIHLLYRQKQREKRHIAYEGPDNTLTKPFHDYFRTHRFICNHQQGSAVLKGLGRSSTPWKATLKNPPIEMNPPTGGRISICMAPMFGSANVRWVIEWMEYHRHAGVTRVHVPVTHDEHEGNARDLWEVFRYYQEIGFVVITPWSSEISKTATQYQNVYERGKILAWNACYLQNRGSTNWLAFVDVDELISGNSPGVTLDHELDFADSEWERTHLPGYALKSTTMAGVFNKVDKYVSSKRLLLDEYSESEKNQNCQAACGKYHQGRDKFMVRSGATELPLEMMWTHAIGGSDYDYADKTMVQLDKSKIYLRHYNGWWLLRDRPGWTGRGLPPLDWKPEKDGSPVHRRDAHIPAGRIYRMQRSIETSHKLKELYLRSQAKYSPDWVAVLETRIEQKTYRPPWEVNSSCAGCNPAQKSGQCSALHSASSKVALLELGYDPRIASLFKGVFPDSVSLSCSNVPPHTFIAAFIGDPVRRFVLEYEKAISLLASGNAAEGAPSLISKFVQGLSGSADYWKKQSVVTDFEEYVNQHHRKDDRSTEWGRQFVPQAAILRHFPVVDYIGRSDQDLHASWGHFLSRVSISDKSSQNGIRPETGLKAHIDLRDVSIMTIDKICGYVSSDSPCFQSKHCDLSWMTRTVEHSGFQRSLLSTKSSDEGENCEQIVESITQSDLSERACPVTSWLDEIQKSDGQPDKVIMVAGCGLGYGAVSYFDRYDASNVLYSRSRWLNQVQSEVGKDDICDSKCDCINSVVHLSNKSLYSQYGIRSPLVVCIEPDPDSYLVAATARKKLNWIGWHGGQKDGAFFLENAFLSNHSVFPQQVDVKTAKVPRTSIDRIMEKHSLDRLDILTVHSESGNELEILNGAYKTFRNARVRYVEITKGDQGLWKLPTTFQLVIEAMDMHGFDCYWAGNRRLWPITQCFDVGHKHDSVSGKIVCTRRFDPWHIVMERFVDQ